MLAYFGQDNETLYENDIHLQRIKELIINNDLKIYDHIYKYIFIYIILTLK